MITNKLLYAEFLKVLTYAYDLACLPLTQRPLFAFVLNGTNRIDVSEDHLAEHLIYEESGLRYTVDNETLTMPLSSEAIRVLKALDRLYDEDVSITASLIARIICAEKTRYANEPLRDDPHIISFTPACVSAIEAYINDSELRGRLEEIYTGIKGPIMKYNIDERVETLSGMLDDATTFTHCNDVYHAKDLRPSSWKAVRHLTNLLYYNLFCFTHPKDLLDEDFASVSQTFIQNMLFFHLHRVPFLSGSFTLKDI